jgi:hypothetical protein
MRKVGSRLANWNTKIFVGKRPDVGVVDHDRTLRRPAEAADHRHERGLAGTRTADDGRELARRNLELDALDRNNVAAFGRIGLADIAAAKHRHPSDWMSSNGCSRLARHAG